MSKRGWVLFAVMSVVWGIPYLLIKVAVEGVSVPVLVLARTVLGALILLPLALRGGQFAALRRHWIPLLAFALIEIIVPWFLLSDAELKLTSSMSGLLIAAAPIIAVLAARLTGGTERLKPLRWVGLAVAFIGVAVLAAPGLRGGDTWSIVEVLLAAVCYGTAPLIAARRLADVPSLPMTVACLAAGALVYATPAALTWPEALPTVRVLVAVGGLAVICTAVAFIVFFALIREVGAPRALVITYINPAVAVAAGVLFLSEPLTVSMIASFALILGGSVLATMGRPANDDRAAPTGEPAGAELPEDAVTA